MLHHVKQLIEKTPYRLVLQFNTGEVLPVDLKANLEEWSKSEASLFRELLDPEQFLTAAVHPEMETIVWENGADLCPDVLHGLAVNQQKQLTRNEPSSV